MGVWLIETILIHIKGGEMTAYEKVREEIAKQLFSMMHPLDDWKKDTLAVKTAYYKRADEILNLISDGWQSLKEEKQEWGIPERAINRMLESQEPESNPFC